MAKKNVDKAPVVKPVKPAFDWAEYVGKAKAEYNRLVAIEMTARGNDEDVEQAAAKVVEHTQAFVGKLQKNEAFLSYVQKIHAANWNVDWNELFDSILSEQR